MLLLRKYDFLSLLEATKLYEEAMKEGSVNISIIKCLVLGIAGVGKTHLKWLLLPDGNDKSTGRVSTGLADNPVQAFVGSVKSILAGVDENDPGRWEVIDEAKLMQVLASAYHLKPTPTKTQIPQPPSLPMASENLTNNSSQPAKTAPKPSTLEPLEAEHHSDRDVFDNPATGEVDSLFIEVFKNISSRKVLNVRLVQFIDSGGQPQFLELLPVFVQDVSVVLYAINLSESLNHCPMIYFYGKDSRPVGNPYKSPSSHKQVLEQCVRAAHARDFRPHLFVVGTHRDEEDKCSETKGGKGDVIKQMVNSEYLICKNGVDVIWDINGANPDSYDQKVAGELRHAIVDHCNDEATPSLPIKWFGLEMLIKHTAARGVISLHRCLQLARSLGMDEQALEAALLHMVKYSLLLWYHNIPSLHNIVFCDPQVILNIISDLVQCKHELAGGDLSKLLGISGVKEAWCSKFKAHATFSHHFLSLNYFKRHFLSDVFNVEHFTALMCHLFIMVPLVGGDYLMPALLHPLSPESIRRHNASAQPLLLHLHNDLVPFGLFSCLVSSIQTECSVLEVNKVPVCLYRNCVSFKCKKFPAQFTIIDSSLFIEVHLDSARDVPTACPRIRKLIYDGITKCSDVLRYHSLKLLKDGFACSNKSCKGVATPYDSDPNLASCAGCSTDMDLTSNHTVWIAEERKHSNGMFIVCFTCYISITICAMSDSIGGMWSIFTCACHIYHMFFLQIILLLIKIYSVLLKKWWIGSHWESNYILTLQR